MLLNKMKQFGVSTKGRKRVSKLKDLGITVPDKNTGTLHVISESRDPSATATNTTTNTANPSELRQPSKSQSGHIGIDMTTHVQLQSTLESTSPADVQKSEQTEPEPEICDELKDKLSELPDEFKDIWHQNAPFYDKLFGLKFPYLQQLHERYGQQKNNYVAIAKEIYSEFIHEDAIHVCNISYSTRENITNFIQSIDDNLDLEYINSPTEIEKYLLVFNYAICETWNLMNSVYNFQYRQHLKGSVALI